MDSKHMQTGVLIAFLAIIAIVTVVIIANWDRFSSDNKSPVANQHTSVIELSVTEEESGPGRQIGNDLYAWKNDAGFFDSARTLEEIENRIITEKIPEKSKDNESNR